MITLKEAKMAGDRLHANWKRVSLRELRLGMSIELVKRNFKKNSLLELGKIALRNINKRSDYYSQIKRKLKR